MIIFWIIATNGLSSYYDKGWLDEYANMDSSSLILDTRKLTIEAVL